MFLWDVQYVWNPAVEARPILSTNLINSGEAVCSCQLLSQDTLSSTGPRGSVGMTPTHADEPGTRGINTSQPRMAGHAKPRAAGLGDAKQRHKDADALSSLEGQTRQLEVESLKASTNVGHALSEIYSPPRLYSPDGKRLDVSKASDALSAGG